MKMRILKLCFVLLAVVCVHGQTQSKSVLDPIPKSKQASLIDALNQAVEFQQNRNWAGIYTLLKKPVSFSDQPNVSQDDYVKQMTKYNKTGFTKILEFTPDSVFFTGDDTEGFAIVFGCGKYKDGFSKPKYKSQAEVYLVAGEWKFSSIPSPSVGIDEVELPKCEKNK